MVSISLTLSQKIHWRTIQQFGFNDYLEFFGCMLSLSPWLLVASTFRQETTSEWNTSPLPRLACIAYQAYFNLAPSNLTELFTKHATKYNLRDNLKFDLTHKFWKGQNDSFIHRASIIWNSLPTKIKTAPSLAAFKASLVKNSKCIDSISFGCSATGTFKNSEDFIYF